MPLAQPPRQDRSNDLENEKSTYFLRRRRSLDLLLRLYSFGGIGFAIAGTFAFIVDYFDINFTVKQSLLLVTIGTSLGVSAISYQLNLLRKQRDFNEVADRMAASYNAELIDAWNTFENVARMSITSYEGDYNNLSIRSIISRLYQENSISDEDVAFLQEGLEYRNVLVHGSTSLPLEISQKFSNGILDIVARLSVARRAKQNV